MVLIVMGVLIAMLSSIISSFTFIKTADDEATLLMKSMELCRRAAIKSNQTTFLELNLDEESYQAYRLERTEDQVKKDIFLKEKKLGESNSLVAVSLANGARIEKGTIRIPFSPEGVAEQMAVYMGEPDNIKVTVFYSRYGNESRIIEGEAENNLVDDEWKDDLEK